MIVNRFEDLEVYREALGVQREIFRNPLASGQNVHSP